MRLCDRETSSFAMGLVFRAREDNSLSDMVTAFFEWLVWKIRPTDIYWTSTDSLETKTSLANRVEIHNFQCILGGVVSVNLERKERAM
jgi:hypothetical protein